MKLKNHSYAMITISFISAMLLVVVFIFLEQMSQKYFALEQQSSHYLSKIDNLKSITFDLYVVHDKVQTEKWHMGLDELRGSLPALRAIHEADPEFLRFATEQLDESLANISRLRVAIDRLCTVSNEKICRLGHDEHVIIRDMIERISAIRSRLVTTYTGETGKIEKNRSTILGLQAFLLFSFILIIFITAFFIIYQILRPLKELSRDFGIISEGNLDYRVMVDSTNEFGDLMNSFNAMIDSIRALTASRNDLEHEIETRRIAEQSNNYQAERFYLVLFHFPGILYVIDPATREILFVNKQLVDLMGNDLIGKTCYKEFQGHDMACHNCYSQGMNPGGEPMTFVFHNNRLDMELLMTEQLISWPDGREVLIKVGVDITRQKKYEEVLNQNQERLESLLGLYAISSSDETEIIDYALEAAVKLSESGIGYLHFVRENQVELELFTWSREVYKDCTAEKVSHYPLDQAGVWADCLRTGEAAIHNDYLNEPGKKGLPEGHITLVKHLSVPIYDGEKIVAIVGVGNKKRDYTSDDVKQLTLFMQGMWGILQRQRAEKNAKKSRAKA